MHNTPWTSDVFSVMVHLYYFRHYILYYCQNLHCSTLHCSLLYCDKLRVSWHDVVHFQPVHREGLPQPTRRQLLTLDYPTHTLPHLTIHQHTITWSDRLCKMSYWMYGQWLSMETDFTASFLPCMICLNHLWPAISTSVYGYSMTVSDTYSVYYQNRTKRFGRE